MGGDCPKESQSRGWAVLGATLRGLLARRAQLVMTAVAVLIGVALVTGTLLLTDAVGRSVRSLAAGAQAGVDVVVDNADDPGAGPRRPSGPGWSPPSRRCPGWERPRGWWWGRRWRWWAGTAARSATGGRRTSS